MDLTPEIPVYNQKVKQAIAHSLAALTLEYFYDLGHSCLSTKAELKYNSAKVLLWCFEKPPDQDVEEVRDLLKRRGVVNLELIFTKFSENREMLTSQSHLRKAFHYFVEGAKETLQQYLEHPKEHLMLSTWRGDTIVVEGSERKVTIPASKLYCCIAHTHPRSICLPSHYDIESILHLLSEGGCCEAILSPTCLLAIGRVKPLDETTYDEMFKLIYKVEKMDYTEVVEKLNEVSAKGSLIYSLIAL